MKNAEEHVVDTSNLKPGMVVKNYKELCKLVNENVKDGTSKVAQLAEWERYFEFEKPKKKQCYVIIEVYKEPKAKTVKIGRPSIYLDYIQAILINFLAKKEGYTETMTKKNWWKTLGMINDTYIQVNKTRYFDDDDDVTEKDLDAFFRRSNFKLDSIFMSALKSLESRKLIFYHVEIVVHWNNKYVVCNEDEEKEILAAERYILTEVMNYRNLNEVYKADQQKAYFDNTNQYIFDLYGYDHYFRQIKIIYNQENMFVALTEEEVEDMKRKLNSKIMEFLMKKIDETSAYWEERFLKGERRWIDDKYQEKQKKIAKAVIELPKDKKDNAVTEDLEKDQYFTYESDFDGMLSDDEIELFDI